MTAILVLLALAAAPFQAAITTALVRDPLAAPVLPVALVAAWAAMRKPEETWPAILLPAVVLGVASEERIGWFLIALLPAPLVASFAVRRFRPKVTGFWRRVLTAGGAGALAAVLYACTLAVVGGIGGELPERSGALLAAAVVSGAISLVVAACFWPLRPRQRGLFE